MKQNFFLSLFSFLLIQNIFLTTYASVPQDEHDTLKPPFIKVDNDFWELSNVEAFKQASSFIDEHGNWKEEGSVPHYLKFVQPLDSEDLPILVRWLSLNGLECFSIADKETQPNLRLILDFYNDLKEQGKLNGKLKENLFKLAWLNLKTVLNEIGRGDASLLPAEWVETNRDFQMKLSHYTPIGAH